MKPIHAVIGAFALVLSGCTPQSDVSAGSAVLRLASTNAELFDQIETVVFLPFETSTSLEDHEATGEDCVSLTERESTPEQLSDIASELDFFAVRRIDSAEKQDHPEPVLEREEDACALSDDPDCSITYFRLVLGKLLPGQLALMAWGTTAALEEGEAPFTSLSSSDATAPDGGTGNEKLDFLNRFAPHRVAESCINIQIEAGRNVVREMVLIPTGL